MLGFEALDIDALADALREDGVVIDRVMGSGAGQESHDRIAELIKNVPFPVYVALVEEPPDLKKAGSNANEVLASLLHRRIGGKGIFLVHSTAGTARLEAYGWGHDGVVVSIAHSANRTALRGEAEKRSSEDYVWVPAVVEAEAAVRAAEAMVDLATEDRDWEQDYPVTLEDEDFDLLADRAVELAEVARWRPDRADHGVREASTGTSAVVAALGGLAAALLLGQTLRGWPRSAPARPGSRKSPAPSGTRGTSTLAFPVVAEEARLARTELTALTERIAKSSPSAAADDLMARVLAAREAAERHVEASDAVTLVGVRTLVRAGERDLTRALRGPGEAFQACFFDPRHPEATGTVGWRLGQGQVRVPCCPACAQDVESGQAPQTLGVKRRLRSVPYYVRDDVWAKTGFGALTDTFASDVLRERS